MLVGRTGLSPTMVGRSAPLARLAGLLTSAGQANVHQDGRGDDGRPSVALVAGEAGIGKTRLLRELIASAPAGTVVLGGQAEHGSLGRPYELVRSMLPDLALEGDDPVRGVVAVIETRLGEAPGLVVFEDLHWADAESLAVFERLASLPRPALLIVGTYRPDELTRRVPASEVFVRLERRHQVHQLRLDRLRRPEVAAFLGSVYHRSIPSTVSDALFNRTGGNPFFLEEILVAAGDDDPANLCAQPLPWSLAELVQRNLDGLSSDDRRVVEAAAVLGRHAPFDVLATMTGCSEDQLIAHLRRLVERGLLLEEDDDEFSFRHALVRDAVEGQLLGRERRRLHAMALSSLSGASCADVAQLARHAAGAGEYDQMVDLAREGVVHYLDRGSPHQALVLALEALPEAPDDVVLLEAAARAAWLAGQYDEAMPHAERWVALDADGGRPGRAVGRVAPARPALPRDRRRRGALGAGRRDRGAHGTASRRARIGPRTWPRWPRSTCSASAPRRPSAGPTWPSRRPTRPTPSPCGPRPWWSAARPWPTCRAASRRANRSCGRASTRPRPSATGCSSPAG